MTICYVCSAASQVDLRSRPSVPPTIREDAAEHD
jgi:hypothetical protein